ncbi:MAG: branched-chain amino acid ABC transporter permease [Paracoccaceae bacterium]
MRIWHQSYTDIARLPGYSGMLAEHARAICGPDTYPEGVPPIAMVGYRYATRLADLQVIDNIIEAEREGYDARLLMSEIGRSIDAIREESRLAKCSGVPVLRVKVTIFTLSCGMAGVAGALSAFFIRYIDPTSFSIIQSLNLVVMNVVGGMYTMVGPVVGTLIFIILPEFLRGYVELQRVIFGVCLILVMAFLPGGIAELAARLRKLAAWRKSSGRE